MQDIVLKILAVCKTQTSINPIEIFNIVTKEDFVRMHGPEHHVIDGACLLVAFKNAGGNIDLDEGLNWIMTQGMKIPGAVCAHWGVCGAALSLGAALSFIDKTGPLSTDGTWGSHMTFTANATSKIGSFAGPRCCKRDAYSAFTAAIEYINSNYDVKLPIEPVECQLSRRNVQCIKDKCPYHKA